MLTNVRFARCYLERCLVFTFVALYFVVPGSWTKHVKLLYSHLILHCLNMYERYVTWRHEE